MSNPFHDAQGRFASGGSNNAKGTTAGKALKKAGKEYGSTSAFDVNAHPALKEAISKN